MDLTAAVEDLQAKHADHAERLDEHEKRLDKHDAIIGMLTRDIGESKQSLNRIEDKLEGRMRDAFNAIPGWAGVGLTVLLLVLAAATFGHDLWPSAHP